MTDSTETVVAKHTATGQAELQSAYMLQSLLTAAPLLIADLAVSGAVFLCVGYLVSASQGAFQHASTIRQGIAFLTFQTGLIALHRLYPGVGASPVDELRGLVRSTGLALLALVLVNAILGELHFIEFSTFVLAGGLVTFALPVVRFVTRHQLSKYRWWGIRTLVVGSQQEWQLFKTRAPACRLAGLRIDETSHVDPERMLSEGDHVAAKSAFDRACTHRTPIVGFLNSQSKSMASRLLFLFPTIAWFDLEPDRQGSTETANLFEVVSRQSSRPLLRPLPRLVKRLVDLAITGPALIVLAIPMALIALAIKLRSPGPVFYGPVRMGQHGKKFRSWKFRTMVVNAEEVLKERLANDPAARREWERDMKLKADPRIIPGIGHLLRGWSLDELPQLWNVLVGEMSLIGPRPIATYEIERYQSHYYDYTTMLPGITGLWQVSGRSETSYSTRVHMVHQYATNWSLWLDACILAKTPFVVIMRRGAY